MSKFARCFPLSDGNVCCEHWNGSFIVFPGYGNTIKKEKSSQKEDNSEEEETTS
jgi:hypothetical protein